LAHDQPELIAENLMKPMIWMLPVAGLMSLSCAVAVPTGADADIATSIRLSPSQYRQTVADIFGNSIRIDGQFQPEQRDKGLLAIGARTTNIGDGDFESYVNIARGIAAQVVDADHRAVLIGCKPAAESGRDDACAKAFITRVGPLLYRRPLSDSDIQTHVAVAGDAAEKLHDFYTGIRLTLVKMLTSPQFLFRYKVMEPDPAHTGQARMNAYSKASELSFFLWNTTPDKELLDAAASGALNTPAGLEHQVDRLIGSRRVADGVRGLFADMLAFSDFEAVTKDPTFFPRYTHDIKDEAQEQTLRTIVDHIVVRHGDYRDLFTTSHTFLTVSLASLYAVPLMDTTDNGQPHRWIAYNYPAGDPRAGILAQASFTALWSPSGRTSPTVRGKALRENLLCQKVPAPPANVSFKFVNDTSNPQYKTTRDRITAHRSEPMCAGCHKLTDPLGLALENFDSAGEFRTVENGQVIDTSGELNGKSYVGAQGLAEAIHNDPAATSCVAQRAFEFETGYTLAKDDAQWQQIQRKFAAAQYDVLQLLEAIALSDLSYRPPASKVL
jgi:hypothetical protein